VEGSVGHLYCRYRVIGDRHAAHGITTRLDRVLRERVPEVCSEALDQALGDDPTVYVLRHVESQAKLQVVLQGDDEPTDAHLAQRWGEFLANAILRSIATDPNDSNNLVRFSSQAEYVAHFVADLLQGRAWNRWFYGAFAPLQSYSMRDAMRTVLLDHRDSLPAILGYLYRNGTLEQVLAVLDNAILQSLVFNGLDASGKVEPESIRPLFAGALQLIDRLELWARRPFDKETLFLTYLARGPTTAHWRDRKALAAALVDVLHFLAAQGYLHRSSRVQDPVFLSQLQQALGDFDWLDTTWLQASVLELLHGFGGQTADLPVRPVGHVPTPRQHELLDDLIALLRAGKVQLDRGQPRAPANVLRLYAALIARVPRWAEDDTVIGIIQRLVDAWAWFVRALLPLEAIRQLRQGDIAGVLRMIDDGDERDQKNDTEAPPGTSDGPRRRAMAPRQGFPERVTARQGSPESPDAGAQGQSQGTTTRHAGVDNQQAQVVHVSQLLMRLGESGQIILETLIGGESQFSLVDAKGTETGCAGVFLLVRAISDVRLPGLVKSTRYPPQGEPTQLGVLLVTLGLRWAGELGMTYGQVDTGLGLLAGLASPQECDDLRRAWTATNRADHDRFQEALLQTLAGQHLVSGLTLHLYAVPLDDGHTALVAGDGVNGLWPLGRVTKSVTDATEIAAQWLAAWERATGHQTTLIVVDAALGSTVRCHGGRPEVVIVPEEEDAHSNHSHNELIAQHQTERQALLAALEALDHGRLGLLAADLTVALTAIAILRVWSRWLRQFATSSIPYILENFIRRTGRLYTDDEGILVEMEPRPLDIVIEMAGYTAELERNAWFGKRRVQFRIGAA
jgi:hypothetical protein